MAEVGEPLSDRELAVLKNLASGQTNREIALELQISPNTVKVHLRNIYTKLGVASRTEATTVALQQGVLTMPGLETAGTPGEPPPADNGDAAASLEQPSTPPQRLVGRRLWQMFALAASLLLILLLGALVGSWLNGRSQENPEEENPPSAEPSNETPIEGSRWLEGQPIPRPRASMAVATVGLNIFHIGGEVEAGVINLTDIFDTVEHRWFSGAAKPTAVTDATAAVLFGEIFVPGGRLADGRPTAVVEAYSPANDAWRPVAPLPRPVAGALALSDGSQVFLFGGWDGDSYLDDVYVFDPGTDRWQTLSSMRWARAFAAGDFVSGQFMVVGGFDGRKDLSICELFEPAGDSWSTCPSSNATHAGAGAAAMVNNLLYISGGGIAENQATAEVYDSRLGQWEEVELPMVSGIESWSHLGVARVETRLYVMGGRRPDGLHSDSYIFAPLVHRTFLPAVGDE